jgi:hypothetical protein
MGLMVRNQALYPGLPAGKKDPRTDDPSECQKPTDGGEIVGQVQTLRLADNPHVNLCEDDGQAQGEQRYSIGLLPRRLAARARLHLATEQPGGGWGGLQSLVPPNMLLIACLREDRVTWYGMSN